MKNMDKFFVIHMLLLLFFFLDGVHLISGITQRQATIIGELRSPT